uniref:DUF4371 domain-containing protein n=1 Tax=Strongyloides venezuelensis TaxID=75913 RepID=A0A0K0G699_STRVS
MISGWCRLCTTEEEILNVVNLCNRSQYDRLADSYDTQEKIVDVFLFLVVLQKANIEKIGFIFYDQNVS